MTRIQCVAVLCGLAALFVATTAAERAAAADAPPAQPPPRNLVPDASFEAPVAAWLAPAVRGACFAGKERAAGAPDGASVLAVQGWEKAGSAVLSPAFALAADAYTATVDVRRVGPAAAGAKVAVELALYDEQGTTKLASLGTAAPADAAGQWVRISAADVKRPGGAARARLAVIVGGPQRGLRVEIDRLGLFAGARAGDAADNTTFTWFEAEAMADDRAWKAQDHYAGWYSDLPSGMKMLAGPDAVEAADNKPVVRQVTARFSGPHRLWVRLMRTSPTSPGAYTVAVRQPGGKDLASRTIDSGNPQAGTGDFTWVWVPLDVDVPAAGPVEVVLTRPAEGTSWIARKIDLFALTNLADYQPDIADFRPQGYVRFTNLSDDQEPYCLWLFVHRMQPPEFYMTPGILHHGGFTGSYYVPDDRDKWLAPGDATPWVKLSNFLVPPWNNLQILATRSMHTEGFVRGRVRGRLEFAVGDARRVVRTVDVDQQAPRLLMSLPQDFENEPERIMTALDHVVRTEAVTRSLGEPAGPAAEHLHLEAHLNFGPDDDTRVVDREVGIIKRLGFNSTFSVLAAPQDAVSFYEARGLSTRFGLAGYYWGTFRNNAAGEPCPSTPDLEPIEARVRADAARYAPVADRIVHLKLADEPNIGYPHFLTCEVCRERFRAGLKEQKLTPQDLGVQTWEQVVPVGAAGREKQPELFYRTGLFRLRAVAESFRAVTEIKRRHFPANAKSFVNYSPPLSWDHHGTDPFFCHRDGALEMTWSEDWLGYGVSPQQASDTFALMRAAGNTPAGQQPMAAYGVGVAGGPLLQRIKLYELVAAGVRTINVYAYGPAYTGVDSWSTRYEIYPVVGQVLHEFGRIDAALHGTTRRKSDLAILYNRTASVWAHTTSTSEQDSRYTRWALSHGGYDADYLPEEDVVAGKLSGYKVLYLNGPQIRPDAAEAIARWVRDDGGVLFGSAGAGSRDEHDRPLATLDEIFGAESTGLKLEQDAGRPMYELRGVPVLDVLSSAPDGVDGGPPAVSFNQLCFRETLTPAAGGQAKVILKNAKGEPSGVMNRVGKGAAVRVAAVPGITYLNDAVRDKDYNAETYLPQKYRAELRDFLTWPARLAGASPVIASSDAPLLEAARYDAPGRAVVFLIDHTATPRQLTLTLPQAAQFTGAYTARGRPVTIAKGDGGSLRVTLPLDVTDALVLEEPADTVGGTKARD